MGKPSDYVEELDVERKLMFKWVLETYAGKF
jgi:hypothetical protein